MESNNISYMVAFTAGLLTFLSPCFLPLIPSYIVYITGIALEDLTSPEKKRQARKKTAIHSIFFIFGFSIIFVLLGLTASAIGKALFRFQDIIRMVGGVLIILFGLNLMGILNLDFLLKEKKFHLPTKGLGYFGSFLVGVTFAAAWTPCAGLILGSILVLAGTKASLAEGAKFLSVYSLGIAVPFFITSLLVNSFVVYFKKVQKFIGAITYISGIFLILLGIAVLTNYLQVLTKFIGAKGAV